MILNNFLCILVSGTLANASDDDERIRGLKGETRVIDLKGKDRTLKKVVFVYKSIPNMKDEKAHVELHGLK